MLKEIRTHHSTILIPCMKILTVGFLFLFPFFATAEPKSEQDIEAFDRVTLTYCYALYVEDENSISKIPRLDPLSLDGRFIKKINDNNRQKIDFLEPYYFLIKNDAKFRMKSWNSRLMRAVANGKSSHSRLSSLESIMITQECDMLVKKLEALLTP